MNEWIQQGGVIRGSLFGTSDGITPGLPVCAVSWTDRAHGFGKGLTESEALLSAAGEALEQHAARQFTSSKLRRAAFRDISDNAFDPRWLCLYSESQYQLPQFPYPRFDPSGVIDWIPGQWLDTGKQVWLPAFATYVDFPAPRAEQFCQVTSNGLAAGDGVQAAAFHAVLELIERDAYLLTWMGRLPAKRLVVDQELSAELAGILRQIEGYGAAIEFYLVRAGIDLPVVVCMAFGNGRDWPGVTAGFGAHPQPRTAVRQSILELGQTGMFLRRIMQNNEQPIPRSPEDVKTFQDHALFYVPSWRARAFDFLRGAEWVRIADLEATAGANLNDLLNPLSRAGIRVAIADLTSPDLEAGPIRVVRALGTHLQPPHVGQLMSRANPRMATLPANGTNNPDLVWML